MRAAWIHENHNTSASQALGLADNSNDKLRSLNVSASYIYDHTWSLTAGRFSIGGTADAALYGTSTGSPNSAGWIVETRLSAVQPRRTVILAVAEFSHRPAIYALDQI